MSAFDPKRTWAFQHYQLFRYDSCAFRIGGDDEATRDLYASWQRDGGMAVRKQSAIPVIGFLRPGPPEASANLLAAFRKGLSETGFVEGRNLAIEFRWRGPNDQPSEGAADLVRRKVDVIVTPGSAVSALAAKALTDTIPIVFSTSGDLSNSAWLRPSTGQAAM